MTAREFVAATGLSTAPQRILIVEDKVSFAVRLAEFVGEFGHRVTAVLGIREIRVDVAHGLDLNGIPIEFHLRGFDLAFLDYYFLSERHNGLTMTAELATRGCPRIVGMSSEPAANARMLAAGATLAFRKSEIEAIL